MCWVRGVARNSQKRSFWLFALLQTNQSHHAIHSSSDVTNDSITVLIKRYSFWWDINLDLSLQTHLLTYVSLLALGPGAALVPSKVYVEGPLINSQVRSKGYWSFDKLSVDLIVLELTFCYGDSSFAARQRHFGPYGHYRAYWFGSNRSREGALWSGAGGPVSS